MKFELCSVYSPTWEYIPKIKEYLLTLDSYSFTITKEENLIYIEREKLIELDLLLTLIPEELYDDTDGWKPESLIIDFNNKVICLHDYYLD